MPSNRAVGTGIWMSQPRVCFFSQHMELVPQLLGFARRLAARGFDVFSVLPSTSYPRWERARGDGVTRIVVPVLPIKGMMYPGYVVLAFLRAVSLRKSILISHEVYTGLPAVLVKLVTRRPFAAYIVDAQTDLKVERGMWKNTAIIGLGRLLERFVASKMDLAILFDRSLLPYAAALGCRNATVIPYCCEVDVFGRGDGSRILDRIGLRRGNIVGYVGGMEPHHGVQYLVRCAAYVRSAFPEAKFLFVGDGPLRKMLETTAEANCIFVGAVPRDEVPDYLDACDVLVVPAAPRSAFVSVLTTKVLEYMAAGKPIVATDIGGISGTLGEAVLIVPPRNPRAMADAVLRVLTTPELREKLVARCKALAETTFDYEIQTNRLAEAIIDLQRG